MTEAKLTAVDDAGEDMTEAVLYSWGLSGEPVGWAPVGYQPTVLAIRSANTGFGDAAGVQAALDQGFPDAGYLAANVMLSHPPVGTFTSTVTEDKVHVELVADTDLVLPDEFVMWEFGDGTVVRDAHGGDHTYAAPGDYLVRLTVYVAGRAYGSTAAVTVEPPLVTPQTPGCYDPADHTVVEVKEYLAEHPEELDAVLEAEEAGKARAGILDL